MSLFSQLLKTYEICSAAGGLARADENGVIDYKKSFLPVYHTTLKTEVCVTLDQNGELKYITRDKKEMTIIIPCDEKSSSRSSGIAPHPLCDQLCYVDKNFDKDKHSQYMDKLAVWKNGDIKLNAIYNFLDKNSVSEIMKEKGLFNKNELDEGNLIAEKIAKIGVRFSFWIPDDQTPNVWEDKNLQQKWAEFISKGEGADGFDYLSGQKVNDIIRSHPKNINSFTGNAKLISCNDKSGVTFRGRFNTQDDGILIDSLSSQKLHVALKWLISNFGYNIDSQATVVWASDKVFEEKIVPYKDSKSLYFIIEEDYDDAQTEIGTIMQAEKNADIDYSKKFAAALMGLGNAEKLKKHSRTINVAIFDAATTGRMNAVFYTQLPENIYNEKIVSWHSDSGWQRTAFKPVTGNDGKVKNERFRYIGCPSFEDITNVIYGKPRSGNDKSYIVFRKKMQKELTECIFRDFALPKHLVKSAAAKVSEPMTFTKDGGGFDNFAWQSALSTACSLIKKSIKEEKKEDITMLLDENRKDRDYLYGRLLAVADRLENYAMYKAGKTGDRPTNAMKMFNSFSVKPYSTWGNLRGRLQPYVLQLAESNFLTSLIDKIMVSFNDGEFEDNNPLSPLFLLGYSAQIIAFNSKKDSQED